MHDPRGQWKPRLPLLGARSPNWRDISSKFCASIEETDPFTIGSIFSWMILMIEENAQKKTEINAESGTKTPK